jgi:hypothetical protein
MITEAGQLGATVAGVGRITRGVRYGSVSDL